MTFFDNKEMTQEEIMSYFKPVVEPLPEENKRSIDAAVRYSVEKYGECYKKLEATDGPIEPQEIEEVQRHAPFEGLLSDYARFNYEEVGDKLNEVINSHNTLLKEVSALRKK